MKHLKWALTLIFLSVSVLSFAAKPTYEELVEENNRLRGLLQECVTALKESSAIIGEMGNQIALLKVVNENQAEQIERLNKPWFMGGSISYPIGAELYGGYMFKDFGLMVGSGMIDTKAYIRSGIFFKI